MSFFGTADRPFGRSACAFVEGLRLLFAFPCVGRRILSIAKKTDEFFLCTQVFNSRSLSAFGKTRRCHFLTNGYCKGLWKTLWKLCKTRILLGSKADFGCGKSVESEGRFQGIFRGLFPNLEKSAKEVLVLGILTATQALTWHCISRQTGEAKG